MLRVITENEGALPADILRAVHPEPGEHAVELVKVASMADSYGYERCDVCTKRVAQHVWVAVADDDRTTTVLRCSIREGR